MAEVDGVQVRVQVEEPSPRAPPPSSSPKAQRCLLEALRRSQLEAFQLLIAEGGVDLDFKYKPDQSTLLITACWTPEHHEFVAALLEAGADPNASDEKGRRPIHIAACRSSVKALQLLLGDKRTEADALDELGASALHYVATPFWDEKDARAHRRCLQLLMLHPRAELNRPDLLGETPLSTAVQQPYDQRIQVMLELGRERLNLDYSHVRGGGTLRSAIARRFPRLQRYLPEARVESPASPDPQLRLLAALQRRDLRRFHELLRVPGVDPNHWYDDPYYSSLLELACRQRGLEAFVSALLEAGADANTRNLIYALPALHQATEAANPRALRLLVRKGRARRDATSRAGHTALHVVAQHQCASVEEEQDMEKCVEELLAHEERPADSEVLAMWFDAVDKLTSPPVNVDAQDECGDTALHDAAYYGNRHLVLTLLRRGADVMRANAEGEPPLAFIDADTLDHFLDEQVRSNALSPLTKQYQIIMRYIFLETTEDEKGRLSEMDAVRYISRSPDFRPLLRHPVINSFLHLKWHTVRWFFFINLIIYVIFVTLITSYVLLINANDEDVDNCTSIDLSKNEVNLMDSVDPERSSIVLNLECKESDENCAQNYMREMSLGKVSKLQVESLVRSVFRVRGRCVHQHDDPRHLSAEEFAAHCLRIPCVYLLVALALREAAQCITDWRRYFTAWVNLIEIFMIFVCGIVLSSDWEANSFKQHISAIAILLTWTELVLMTGRLPMLSVQLEMLKKVSYTFLRFMAWYSLLVIAFALSFYTLFRRSRDYDPNNKEPFFLHPGLSFMKTIFMMVGELEASDIAFDSVPWTSHVVFMVFIILVAIILLNLMNGLAVYDTQAIKDDAELLGLVSMVELISYLEMTLLAVGSRCFHKDFYLEFLEPRIRVFKRNIPKKEIHVFPNSGKVDFFLDSTNTKRFSGCRIAPDIMATATDIVNEKKHISGSEQLKRQVSKLEKKIEEMEKTLSTQYDNMSSVLETLAQQQRKSFESTI